jgi:hypothetical protein
MNQLTLGIGKPFAWSYSKLKNFDVCPRRYHEVDVRKRVKEASSESLHWGDEMHKAMAKRLSDKVPLSLSFKNFEPLAERLEAVHGELLTEQQLAITADFTACTWFSRDAWFRSIADVLIINKPVALAIDYKTGKIIEDIQQLALLSACVFAHFSDVLAVRTEFWWVREDAITRQDFKRKDMPDMWRQIWPRYEQLKHAHDTNNFPPKPGGLCKKYCPVSDCEYHGR